MSLVSKKVPLKKQRLGDFFNGIFPFWAIADTINLENFIFGITNLISFIITSLI